MPRRHNCSIFNRTDWKRKPAQNPLGGRIGNDPSTTRQYERFWKGCPELRVAVSGSQTIGTAFPESDKWSRHLLPPGPRSFGFGVERDQDGDAMAGCSRPAAQTPQESVNLSVVSCRRHAGVLLWCPSCIVSVYQKLIWKETWSVAIGVIS